jgi:glutathione S-transferase
METPWDKSTETPTWNPPKNLPILIENWGNNIIYESHLIMEYIEARYTQPPTLTHVAFDARILPKKIEVVADGVCGAIILEVWEQRRENGKAKLRVGCATEAEDRRRA